MSKISFISSLLVIQKKCFLFILFTLISFNLFNCLTLLSANLLNKSFGYESRYEWPLISLSKQTNHKNNNFSHFSGVYATNQSFGEIHVKSSDPFGRRSPNSGPQYIVDSYSSVSNKRDDNKIDGKYKSKSVRSVANSGKLCLFLA